MTGVSDVCSSDLSGGEEFNGLKSYNGPNSGLQEFHMKQVNQAGTRNSTFQRTPQGVNYSFNKAALHGNKFERTNKEWR